MRLTVRSFSVAVLLALHAALTLGGSGLHALPGMGHGSELNRPSRNDHSHGPGKSSHDLAEECPVCHFLTDDPVRSEGEVGVTAWLVTAAEPPAPPPADPSPSQSPTATRAPPARS